MKDQRIGIMKNVWGWRSLRGIRWWLSCWAFPYTCHGVEVTSDVPPVYRGDVWPLEAREPLPPDRIRQRLHVIERIVKIGPIWFRAGRFTEGFVDGKEVSFDARGERVVRYPYGRLQAWRTRRHLERIERENRRRADERAMREGCS